MSVIQQIAWIAALLAFALLIFRATGEHYRGKVMFTKPVVIAFVVAGIALYIAY